MNVVKNTEYQKILLDHIPVIDVRAPIEFSQGSIPGSVNLPILNDQERALIGTTYKTKGAEQAIQLGYQIVSGENKNQKIQAWILQVKNQQNILMTCFRGGQRSQISQRWLSEEGFEIKRFSEGYKGFRAWVIDELKLFSKKNNFRILSGTTGSGKTKLIQKINNKYPAVDLEKLANHKGSAFGRQQTGQPSQADFENRLFQQILIQQSHFKDQSILFEDESRMIGRVHLTEDFFSQLRSSDIILMKIQLSQRIENIFEDYVVNTAIGKSIDHFESEFALELFDSYILNTEKISKRLGGLRAREIISDLSVAKNDYLNHRDVVKNKIWIEKLLVWYYDPLYLGSLALRQPKVEFQGNDIEIESYLSN